MRIHLLDMGRTKYGDCILVTHGERKILIDGAHPGDASQILSQLEKLLRKTPPFVIDLLVVTHCHSDHIGCLPALIADGDIKVKFALVADERLGWGRDFNGDSPADSTSLTAGQKTLVAALQEEDCSDLSPEDLTQFLTDAASLEQKYQMMLDALVEQKATIVRYGRDSATKVKQIEEEFAEFGLAVLGPTRNHLLKCADAIAQTVDLITTATTNLVDDSESPNMLESYRLLVKRFGADAEVASDQAGVGAAKNNQSIVLTVEADGWSALLAGDMQFAKAEVPGLNSVMATLRQKVVDAGPYDFIKLTHHTSYNAIDSEILDEWTPTKLFAHTGGSNDRSHPEQGVLELLRERKESLKFARTDRNGIITVERVNGVVGLVTSRGRLNDFSINEPEDEPEVVEATPQQAKDRPVPIATPSLRGVLDGDVVEVIAHIPHRTTKVTLTIEVETEGVEAKFKSATKSSREDVPNISGKTRSPEAVPKLNLAGGRPLQGLVFVTCRPRLEENIGKSEASQVFHSLEAASGIRIVDIPETRSAEEAAELVRKQLASSKFVGVVILGGYDVVPSYRLDVLDKETRYHLEAEGSGGKDADDFIVWSDELYGDQDGDFMAELPVSRIPDGRLADVVFAALQAGPLQLGQRFGVRNIARPFATKVFPLIQGPETELLVSRMASPDHIPRGAAAGAVYFMLHGSARDGTRFWGEADDGSAYEAVGVENVPDLATGSVVFSGCCWGALSASPPAVKAGSDTPIRPRGPESSVAIAYLKAGALGFVGCTGSHYSPVVPPYNYFGKPMHEAFWIAIGQGKMPAAALFQAKQEFARRIPHGRTDLFSQAVELKLLRQFTCLGLGW